MPKDNEAEIALEFEDTEKNLEALKAKATGVRLDGEEKPFDISEINEEKDDEFLKSLGTEDEEIEDEEEETEEEVEEKEDVKKEEEEVTKDVEKPEDLAVKEILSYLEKEGTTKIKVKGVERDLKDLTAEEIRVRLQKGDRFYDEMENLSVRRKELDEREKTINQGAEQVNSLMARYSETGVKPDTAIAAPELQINAFDNEETKALKQYLTNLQGEVSNLKQTSAEQSNRVQSQNLLSEIDSLKDEFPLLSKEEVIAMKAVAEMEGKSISARDIAEVSHRHYSGDKYFDAVLKARPEKERELKEKHIKEYLAKKGKAVKVGRSPSSSTASEKASSEKKAPKVNTFDEIEAQTPKLKKMLRDLEVQGEES